ncbi:MAG: efflux RND transporter permease subunit [Nitrospira sp.]|nr:efflux RND transporter permease subunit [Nitrospira sp.]
MPSATPKVSDLHTAPIGRVVMEVARNTGKTPSRSTLFHPHLGRHCVPLSALAWLETSQHPAVGESPGRFPALTLSFNLPPGASLSLCRLGCRVGRWDVGLLDCGSPFQGRPAPFSHRWRRTALADPGGHRHHVPGAGNPYESLIHPITILSTLPSAGVGAAGPGLVPDRVLSDHRLDRVILLIGIVKKNAIMMIDFALHSGTRMAEEDSTEAIYEKPVCCGSVRS